MDRFCRTVQKYIGQGNAAVEKFAEEHRLGLAKESPLEADTKRDGRGKEYFGGAFRDPLKAFDKAFLAFHAVSIHEIWVVHQKSTGALNYGNLLANIEGKGGKSYQDAVAELSDMEKRYDYWYAKCRPENRDACINVFGRGMNFKWASMTMEIDRGTVKGRCIEGLERYRELAKGDSWRAPKADWWGR